MDLSSEKEMNCVKEKRNEERHKCKYKQNRNKWWAPIPAFAREYHHWAWPETDFVEFLTSSFNLSSLLRSPCFRIKLPCLPSHKVVCAVNVWIIAPSAIFSFHIMICCFSFACNNMIVLICRWFKQHADIRVFFQLLLNIEIERVKRSKLIRREYLKNI